MKCLSCAWGTIALSLVLTLAWLQLPVGAWLWGHRVFHIQALLDGMRGKPFSQKGNADFIHWGRKEADKV